MNMHTDSPPPLPPLRDDLRLIPGPPLEDGSPTWTLHDPARNAFFRVGWAEFEMLSRWHLSDPSSVREGVNRETTLEVSNADVQGLHRFLQTGGLLRPDRPDTLAALRARTFRKRPGWITRILKNYLFFRIPLFRPDRFLGRTLPYARALTSRPFLLLLLIAGLAGLLMAVRQWEAFIHTFVYFFSVKGLFFYGIALFFAKLCHELGHAYTSRHYGLHVPTMGVAFLVLWPVLYSDNSEAWKIKSRRARMTIVSSGILVELVLALLATFLWSFLPDGPLRSACFFLATVSWIGSLAINLSPFLRFDGYYLLSDFWDVPNLHKRSGDLGRWFLRKTLLGLQSPPPERFSSGRQRQLILFAYATWIYRLFLFTAIALLVYHLAFKALGILLFSVEITWFLLMPVFKELKAWWTLRSAVGFNPRVFLTALGFGVLFLLFLIPYNTRIHTPALLKSGISHPVYPPFASRVDRIEVKEGEHVEPGNLLFRLRSPLLEHRKELAEIQIRMLESRLKRLSVHSESLDTLRVIQQELAGMLTERQGLRMQLSRLDVKAPSGGVIKDLSDGLRPGRWVADHQLLCILVTTESALVEGFVEEADLGRIRKGNRGMFYEEGGGLGPVSCVVEDVDVTASSLLKEPYHASLYGGDIPVRQDEKGLATHQSVYRVLSRPTETGTHVTRVLRGTLVISGRPESAAHRAWRRVHSVLIRESGF